MPPPGEAPEKQPTPAPKADAAEPADAALVLTRMVAEGGSVLTVAPGERGQGEVIAVEEPLLLTEPLPTEAPSPPAAPSPPPAAATPAAPAAPRWIGSQRTIAPRAAPAGSAPGSIGKAPSGNTPAGAASAAAGTAWDAAIAFQPRWPHDRGDRARSAGAHAAGLAGSASQGDRRAPGAGGDRSHQPEVGVLSAVEVPARLPA